MNGVAIRIKEEYPTVTTQRISTASFNQFNERIQKTRNLTYSAIFHHFPSDQLLAMLDPANPSEEEFKLLSSDELQAVCENVECVRRISTSGYMLTNWRFYRFHLVDAKNKGSTFGNSHSFASYDKVGGVERNDGPKDCVKITGMTIALMSFCGSPSCFSKLLVLDVHSSALTKNMLIEHVVYGMKLFRGKGIDFDRVKVTLLEGCEDVFSTAFPGVQMKGKTLLLEASI